ncbi:MAG TPA: hypothetical protein VHS03_06085 [Gaiellaceae bacterium]|nr:hypothetical protein [Gaiellaceae bacterium]
MADRRRFRTKAGWREPSVKGLQALAASLGTRDSAAAAREKIERAIDDGSAIDLAADEQAEVVAAVRKAMQDGRVDSEIAGIRHDEST